jgi:hypothetical protein
MKASIKSGLNQGEKGQSNEYNLSRKSKTLMTVFLVLIPDGVKNVNTSSAIKACQIRPY